MTAIKRCESAHVDYGRCEFVDGHDGPHEANSRIWWDDDNDEELLQEAVELANGADQVLVFLGLPGEDESEGLAELVAEL